MFEKIKRFLKELRVEMTKVSWSTKQEVVGSTIIVIVLSFLLALFIGVVDKFLSVVISLILK
jgi:preprotein translocase subunit SecE